MSSSLTHSLDPLRRQVRRTLLWRGLCLSVTVLLGTTLAAVAADWLFHIDDPGLRRLILLWVLAATGITVFRRLVVPLRTPLDDVALAQQIERRFPRLRDRLASAVQFAADAHDPRHGSPVLQQQLVADTLARLQALDLDEVIHRRRTRRLTLVVAGALATVMLLFAWRRSEASTGLDRLFLGSDTAWPRRTHLQFLDDSLAPADLDRDRPWRVSAGETVELIVENTRGALPEGAVIEFRGPRAAVTSEPLRSTVRRVPGQEARDVGVVVVAVAGEKTLWFRARGDDHVTDWFPLKAVPPPLVESLQVTRHPPAYTLQPALAQPADVGDVQGLVGTRIMIRATINQRVARAWLHRTSAEAIAAEVEQGGRVVTAEFEIDEPGVSSWWFSLVDAEGLAARRPAHYEVRGQADRVPEVHFVTPDGNLQATADAVLDLRLTAADDLALVEVRLVVSRADRPEEPPLVIPLRGAEEGLHPGPQPLEISHRWDLGPLKLAGGSELVFRAEATDAYDLGEPHVGRSAAYTLTIVSAETKREEIATRQAALLGELAGILGRQRDARNNVRDLSIQWKTAGRLRPGDVDLLLGTELHQRQIAAQLADDQDGLGRQAARLAEALTRNQLDDPEAGRHLERIAADLDQLGRHTLPPLESALADARRRVAAGSDARQLGEPLEQTGRHQQTVITTLEELLGDLSAWQGRRQLLDDARALLRRQQQLVSDTAALPEETLNKRTEQLSRQQQANLKRLGQQQRELAEQLQRLTRQIEQPRGQDDKAAPGSREQLEAAARTLDEQSTVAAMREAGRQLDENLVGRALENEQRAARQLQTLAEALRDEATSEARGRLDQLDQLRPQLERLRQQQQQLRDDTRGALGQPPVSPDGRRELLGRQEALGREAESFRQRLGRMPVPAAQRSARRATDAMGRAAAALEQPGLDGAAAEQGEAISALEQTGRELESMKQDAADDLAAESDRQLSNSLRDFKQRQQQLLEQTGGLDETKRKRGRWTRPLLKSLLKAQGDQQRLVNDTAGLLEKLDGNGPAAVAVSEISDQMRQAVEELARRQTGRQARDFQQRAIELIDRLFEQADKPAGGRRRGREPGQPGQRPGSPQQNAGGSNRPTAKPRDLRQAPTAPASGSGTATGTRAAEVRIEALRRSPWGHLPPALRRELINAGRERPPAKYAEAVRRYYEQLATGSENR